MIDHGADVDAMDVEGWTPRIALEDGSQFSDVLIARYSNSPLWSR